MRNLWKKNDWKWYAQVYLSHKGLKIGLRLWISNGFNNKRLYADNQYAVCLPDPFGKQKFHVCIQSLVSVIKFTYILSVNFEMFFKVSWNIRLKNCSSMISYLRFVNNNISICRLVRYLVVKFKKFAILIIIGLIENVEFKQIK